jgi:hypothetical protein
MTASKIFTAESAEDSPHLAVMVADVGYAISERSAPLQVMMFETHDKLMC